MPLSRTNDAEDDGSNNNAYEVYELHKESLQAAYSEYIQGNKLRPRVGRGTGQHLANDMEPFFETEILSSISISQREDNEEDEKNNKLKSNNLAVVK